LVPLLRSIASEIRDRNQRLAELEARSAQLTGKGDVARDELALVRSELSLHARELRRAERELARLGWSLDPDDALRLVRADSGAAAGQSRRPEDTGFYRASAQTR
jgi:hypothetical protein